MYEARASIIFQAIHVGSSGFVLPAVVGLVRPDDHDVPRNGDGVSEIITSRSIGCNQLAPVGIGKGKVGQTGDIRIDLDCACLV